MHAGGSSIPGAEALGSGTHSTSIITRRGFLRRGLLLGGGLVTLSVLAACAPSPAPAPPPAEKPTGAPAAKPPEATKPAAAASPAASPAAQPAASPTTAPAAAKPTEVTKVSFRLNLADAVTVGRAQNIPVVSTAVLLQQSPTVLVALKDKGITKPTDLYGKRVGVNPQSTVYAFWIAFTKVNDIDRSKLTEINVTGSAIGPLVAGTFDATGLLLTNEVVTLESQGQQLDIINYADYGVKSYGQVVFTNDTFLKEKTDLARRVTSATLKSWEYTLSHVDEAIDALAEAVPETDKKVETAKWTPIKQLVNPAGGQQTRLGQQTLEGWQETYRTFKEGGLIEQDFDPKLLFATL